MTVRAASFSFTLFLTAATAHAQSKVGVVALGVDSEAAAALQLRMEQALSAQPGVQLVRAVELAPKLAIGPAYPVDDAALTTLVTLARNAYAEDRPLDAFHRLSEASKMIDAGKTQPGADKSTMLLLRAAIYHAMGDTALAQKEAETLLALAPDLPPEPRMRPAFVELLEELRKKQRSSQVAVTGVPAEARIEVDGRIVGPNFRIAPGRHELYVRAPGLRPTKTSFDATSNVRVSLIAALEPGEKQRTSLETAVWNAPPDNTLSELGRRLQDVQLVVVSLRADGALRGLVRRSDGSIVRSDVEAGTNADLTIATWAARNLRAQKPVVSVPSANAPSNPFDSRPQSAPIGLAVRTSATFMQRQRAVEGAGGASFDATFAGIGVMGEALAARGAWMSDLRATFVSFDVSRANFDLPDGSAASVLGGKTVRLDASAGRTFVGSRESAFAAGARLEGVWERHDAQDLSSGDGDLGLFASYQRFAAGIGAVAVANLGRVQLDAAVSAHPLHLWTETEAKSGESPRGGVTVGLNVSAAAELSRGFALRAGFAVEQRQVSFRGEADAPVSPPIEDARHTERIHAFTFGVARSF